MILTYLRRELRRRRRAQLVIASGLALGIALVIVVNAVSAGMQRAQDEVLRSLYGLGTDLTVSHAVTSPADGEEGQPQRPRFEFDAREGEEQSSDMLVVDGFQTLDESAVATIADIEGVAGAVGGLALRSVGVRGAFDPGEVVEGAPGEGPAGGQGGGPSRDEVGGGGAAFDIDQYAILGTDVAHVDQGPLSAAEVTDGRTFTADDAAADVALLDTGYAAGEELAVGDTLTVGGADLEIVGLTAATEGDAAADVYLPLARAQELSDNEGALTDVYVRATDSQRLDAVEAAITERVEDADVVTADDLADQVSGSLSTAADLADGLGRWLSYLVLGSAFLVAGLLASSAVTRRVREFGTLKALGWSRGRVTRQVMAESLATGLFGGAIGLAAGVGAAAVITAVKPSLTAELGAAASLPTGPGAGGGPEMMRQGMDQAATALDIALTAPVSLGIVALAGTLAIAGGLFAGTFATWRASRLRPADALARVA
ncbi:ABC transporter permease [Streptomyces hainanensis]|uniref:FtsX-like permease family protein n=1 Tax=Streptomyces hainanensis TaxID=402648 RepID=A0A4R4SEW6_9ACTN|nr:FtsX-like permease family protein [Streptomyces hainanensis]TDC61851.1 FtsX-like permease family protein [Streptomyces hainanensis]